MRYKKDMNMYEQTKAWLKALAEEEGGVNRLASRFEAPKQKMRRALDNETDPAASDFVGWLESAGARFVYPAEEEKRLRIVRVPMAEAELGAGSSFFHDDEAPEEAKYYTFREDFIARLGASVSSLRLFRVRGDSMEPELYPGDVVLVQMAEGVQVKDGGMYVVRYGMELLIKRIFKIPGGQLHLRSTNEKWPSPSINADVEDFQIVGIPRWVGRAL